MLDLYGCPSAVLDDAALLTEIIEKTAAISNSRLLKTVVHPFPTQGVTALALLAESHIALHTWPEYGYAAVDLFACGAHARTEAGCAHLIKALQASRHSLSSMRRGHGVDMHWMNEELTPMDAYRRCVTNTLYCGRSEFQEICIADAGAYGKALLLDGQLQLASADEFLYHEALVHPAMLQAASPQDVLILGGGDGATIREVLRWRSVRRVTMVEIDRQVVEACREHLACTHQGAFDDRRVKIVIDDAFHFLQHADRTWDVILSDLPDPTDDAPWLRLFTHECFKMIGCRLSREGSFALQAGPVSPISVAPLSHILRNASNAFDHVHVYSSFIPSYGIPLAFVIAAKRPLSVRPNPDTVNGVFAEQVSGKLRMLDGDAFAGLMQPPLYLREAMKKACQGEGRVSGEDTAQ